MHDDYHIAISAASNQELEFVADLKQILTAYLGEVPLVWTRNLIRGNQNYDTIIRELFPKIKVFVIVWSPSYRKQCQGELDLILSYASIKSGRLFVVEFLPEPRTHRLAGVKGYKLWKYDEYGRAQPLASFDMHSEINTLADDLAEALRIHIVPKSSASWFSHLHSGNVNIGIGHVSEQELEILKQQISSYSSGQLGDKSRSNHVIFFLMFPFVGYSNLETALREVIEDRWECQLCIASDRHWEDTIWGNILAHMDNANAYIAEISEASPNVMFELGAVARQMDERPTLLLRNGTQDNKARVPADLRGFMYLDYGERGDKSLADYLEEVMRRKDGVKALLDGERERYLSPRRMQALARLSDIPETVFQVLADKYPTRESWRYVGEEDIRKDLGTDADLADVLIRRIKAG